jgi:hypothetical protein
MCQDSPCVDAFVKLPPAEQKARAIAFGATREGDEKRTNMTELCLWVIRLERQGLTDQFFCAVKPN